MTAAILKEFMPYGAPELQEAARPNMVRALATSSLLATVVFALAWSLSLMWVHRQVPVIPISATPHWLEHEHSILQPPPPIMSVPVARPKPASAVDAIPVPAKDTRENLDRTIPSQGEKTDQPSTSPTKVGQPGGEAAGERVPRRDEYVYAEVLPEPITQTQPVYPGMAQQAGVEGLVIIHALIGKDGRVLDAQVDAKKNAPILNDAALEAARKWVFTPALSNGHPVMVWVTIPFRFKLH